MTMQDASFRKFFREGGSSQKGQKGRFLYLVVMSHNGVDVVREMKYTSQHPCDKTMDGKMAL